MIVNLLWRSVSPILDISRPSIIIRPSVASTKRKKDNAKVLFPEPVRPKMPTYGNSQIGTTVLISRVDLLSRFNGETQVMQDIWELRLVTDDEAEVNVRVSLRLTAYLITRFSHLISPLDGHDGGGRGSTNSGSSLSSSEYSFTRSSATCL